MPNVNLAPDSEQARINRRRLLAQALQQQAMQPIQEPGVPGAQISPWQGVSQLVNALMAGLVNRKLDKKQTSLDTTNEFERNNRMQSLVNAMVPQAQGSSMSVPMAPTQAAPIPEDLSFPNDVGQTPAPQQPEGARSLDLPASQADTAGRGLKIQQLARALSSKDPAVQQFAQMAMQNEMQQGAEQRGQQFDIAKLMQQQAGQQALQQGSQQFQAQNQNIDPLSPQGIAAQQQLGKPTQRNIDPLSPEGIAAQQQLQQTKAPSLSEVNVNIDGKPAVVLRDGAGNFIDANTKKPVTGRITPYIAPPTPRARGEITPTAEAQVIDRLNKQWEAASKDVQSVYRANTIMDAGLDAARRGDMNAGSQAILVTFQKFLDPTSVVRESEYARSGAGLAMADRIRGYIEKLSQGGAGVTLPELEKFAQLGKEINQRLASEGNSLLSSEKQRITKTAERYNIPPELAIPQYNLAQPATVAPPPASSGGWSVKVKK